MDEAESSSGDLSGRAVILTPSADTAAGGVERFAHLIAGLLERRGWEVELVCPSPAALWAKRIGAGYVWSAVSSMRAAEREEPDLIVSNGFLGAPISGRRRVHVFHSCMVELIRHTGADLRWHDRVRRTYGGGLAEAVAGRRAQSVAVSQSAADEVRRHYRISVDAVIPNGVDTEVFRPGDRSAARRALGLPETSRLALFVGRWEPGKCPELAATACRMAGFDFVVAGSGPIPSGVRLLGSLSPTELAVAYAAADCVVVPSLYEGYFFVPMESLAVGTPVITTGVGVIPELLAAVPAYSPLVVFPDAGAIAAALQRLDEEVVQGAVREAHRHVVEHHNLARFNAAWEAFLLNS